MEASEDKDSWMGSIENLKGGLEEHFSTFYGDMEKEVFYTSLLSYHEDMPKEMQPEVMASILNHKKAKKGKTDAEKIRKWVDYAFSTSIMTDEGRARAFLNDPDLKTLQKDLILDVGK